MYVQIIWGAAEMDWWVKYLLCKYEEPELTSRIHFKNLSIKGLASNSSTREAKAEDLGVQGSPLLLSELEASVNYMSLCLQK